MFRRMRSSLRIPVASLRSAICLLGHPVLGGALGAFGAIAGVTLGASIDALRTRLRGMLANSPAPAQLLDAELLYVAWPELWSGAGPLRPAVERDAELLDLLLPLSALLRQPALVTRPAPAPRMLRAQLLHRLPSMLDAIQPVGSEGLPEELWSDPAQVPVLFERSGVPASGRLRPGLLASFGISFEPIWSERTLPSGRPWHGSDA
jgi:hypothetical protein